MKCKVCGSESGRYPLCRACNIKKEKGQIIKCNECGRWHLVTIPCDHLELINTDSNAFLYDSKKTLMSNSEQNYYKAILANIPSGYCVFPQVNLASFINKNGDFAFHNELFRNVDFLITDDRFKPLFIIEINDQTHLNNDRKERDEKVKNICEEAGIPILKLWTSYGVNENYINSKIIEIINSLPAERIHHFDNTSDNKPQTQTDPTLKIDTYNTRALYSSYKPHRHYRRSKAGCYVATCVYGSYDCPEVWVLRRFRDTTLASTWYGRLFIKMYYLISPVVVKCFGKFEWFHSLFRPILNKFIDNLKSKGVGDTPYYDVN